MSRDDGRYSVVRNDSTPAAKAADDAEEARDFGKTVHVQYKGLRVAVPSAVLAAAVSAIATFYATHSTPVDCASRGDVNALDMKVSKQAEDLRNLTMLVNANAERAHNDITIMTGTLLTMSRQK
jgi:hypothetical protein